MAQKATNVQIYREINNLEQEYESRKRFMAKPNRQTELSYDKLFNFLFYSRAYHELKEKFPDEYLLGKLEDQ